MTSSRDLVPTSSREDSQHLVPPSPPLKGDGTRCDLVPQLVPGGGAVNLCRACGQEFGSLSGFDAHRVGRHDYTYSEGVHMEPIREDGRRCLATWELEQAGWHKDKHGRWRMPRPDSEVPFWDSRSTKSGDGMPSSDPEPIPAMETPSA